MRRGMTLLELMISGGVMSIVLLSVMTTFLTAQRMMRTAMAESELSLAGREIREKLLFRMSPTIGEMHYAGLLSGTNTGQIVDGSGTVELRTSALGSSLSDMRSQSMRLKTWSEPYKTSDGESMTAYYLINEHTPDKDAHRRWLWPVSVSLAGGSRGYSVSCERKPVAQQHLGLYRLNLDISLRSDVRNPDGTPIIRNERVHVPLFGKLQPEREANGDY